MRFLLVSTRLPDESSATPTLTATRGAGGAGLGGLLEVEAGCVDRTGGGEEGSEGAAAGVRGGGGELLRLGLRRTRTVVVWWGHEGSKLLFEGLWDSLGHDGTGGPTL